MIPVVVVAAAVVGLIALFALALVPPSVVADTPSRQQTAHRSLRTSQAVPLPSKRGGVPRIGRPCRGPGGGVGPPRGGS
eukprot:CAMPEP_0183310994 /NCGR_PEP_ID=MMETSP0160_2-20130417/34675_1 /TAXON_ID=2839 ORGANISM="Odontella Sinensis, Strain Grunow 1884" /NCGR_SAMPLE_ID=MMETSP0160_2 /ASSEMBLY_ACC=CAM_ASM_000250 /LENGTH=78 /DNA_ID=CAMNT_0025475443 /DNA_START=41 /DNA_END=274 /DNA_ORIENTATION=-